MVMLINKVERLTTPRMLLRVVFVVIDTLYISQYGRKLTHSDHKHHENAECMHLDLLGEMRLITYWEVSWFQDSKCMYTNTQEIWLSI